VPGLFSGPNAVLSINRLVGGVTNYNYDNNGNMLSGDGRTMSYNVFNKPLTIGIRGRTE